MNLVFLNKYLKTVKKYFSYDDEYITGGQYFLRGLLSSFLCLILVGLIMWSVNAYKRAKSLGKSEISCRIWAVWGFLLFPMSLTQIAPLTNTIPHLYLWWSNGSLKSDYVGHNKTEYKKQEQTWSCVICNTQNEIQSNECSECNEKDKNTSHGRLTT